MRTSFSRFLPLLALACLAVAMPAPALAQPYSSFLYASDGFPTSNGWVEVPSSPALNPTGAFTFEAWVAITNDSVAEDCRSIAGKDYTQAWWVGLCTVGGKPVLRSYLKGGASSRNGGEITRGEWTHVGVVFDGSHRYHYINGELAASFAESGPLTTSTSPLRIFSDVSWAHTPDGSIDEVRLWNVARTQSELRASINQHISTPQAGLVAQWSLDSNAEDLGGAYDGSMHGSNIGFYHFVTAPSCTATPTRACLQGSRFTAQVQWRTDPAGTQPDGNGTLVTTSADSALYWFFAPTNWELMVKVLDACGLNNRFWVFSAATTNVYYRLAVFDVQEGVQKIYFNYPGPPAPAVTDTSAFATCP